MNSPAPDRATRLAIERTRVAYERTMMAWVRTGTSLITFGFTVYKFFQFDEAVKLSGRMLVGPREFAMILENVNESLDALIAQVGRERLT